MRRSRGETSAALALCWVLLACEERPRTSAVPPLRPVSPPAMSDSGLPAGAAADELADAGAGAGAGADEDTDAGTDAASGADAGSAAQPTGHAEVRGPAQTKTRAATTDDGDCPPRVEPDPDDPEACHPSCSCLRGAWVCTPNCGVRLSDLEKTSDVIVETTDWALQQELGKLLEPWRRNELLSVSEQLTTSRRQFQGLTWGLMAPKDQAALQASVEAFAKRHGKEQVRLRFRDPREFRLRLVIASGAAYRPADAKGLDVKSAVRDLVDAYPGQVEHRLGRQSGEGDLELIYSLEALPAAQRQVLLRDLRALAKRAGKAALLVEYTE